jgi:single-stranded-DNA-specific exonuclease
LDDQNKDRQRITREIQQAVMNLTPDEAIGFLVCARDESFQAGVVGLAASRLVEHYYRPAIVGTKNTHTTRASCRSINEFNITAALDACSELLEHHGGHHMAAGFTVKNENWDELINRLQAIAEDQLKDKELQQSYTADAVLEGIDQVTELLRKNTFGNIYDLSDILEPTGMGNSEVIFIARNLVVKDCRAVGEEKSHLKLVLGGENRNTAILDGIAFRQGHWLQKGLMGKKLDILFKFEKNTFQGVEKNQLNISDIRLSE